MFYGKENRMLDEKGRISLNRRVREELGNIPVITKRGQKIRIFPEQKKDEFKPSQIWLGKIDKQGRLLIPNKLLFGFFNKKIIILLGKGDYIEIRSRNKKENSFQQDTLDEGISILKEVKERC